MNRLTLSRMLLAAGASLALVALLVAMVYAPVAVAGDDVASANDRRAAQPGAGTPVCFASQGALACVDRFGIRSTGTLTDQVRALMLSMLAGPTAGERAQGVRTALPDGAALHAVRATPERAVVTLDLPETFLSRFDAGDAEDVNEQIATTLTPFNFARIDVEVRDPAQPATFRPLSSFLPSIRIPAKPGEPADSSSFVPHPSSSTGGQPPEYGHPQSAGGLGGKTVFVSAGHGWYWNSTQGQYRTQRPEYPNDPYPPGEGIVEDFNNAEIVNQYLLQYLWNAGADAWTVRERDLNTAMQIVDNAGPAFSTQGSWSTGSGGYNGTYSSTTSVTSTATATATWTFTPTADAEYAVYVQFPNASNRTPAARYAVEHAGGTTVLTVTQQRDGNNWRYIGTYPFRSGMAYRVRLGNQSTLPGATVLADAIRIGGGIGDTTVGTAPTPSGKPRWEEQARQYAKWVGLPDADDLNDVIIRPIYSEWEYESGEDAIYISYHSNGYNGYNTTARGSETYIHSFEPTTDSNILQNYIHAELLGDIHAGWEAGWPDRGKKSLDLGELRLLDTMPGVLIENGYHDNPQDVEAEKDPRFNLLSARGIYQGIVRYWHSQDPNVPLAFLPEPPTHLVARNSGPGQVALAWRAGPTDTTGLLGGAAASYRVYTSTDGFGWGNAISTTATSLTLNGLAANQLIFVRVSGVNAGGESFPTPVLAARVTSGDVAPVLIVYGFDRIDRRGLPRQFDGAEGYSRRMLLDRVNRYDYIIQHAAGITLSFDSAAHAAVTDGDVGLGNYVVADWIAGEEQSPDVVLNATDQSLLQSFLDGGGALLISGAEIGFDLVSNGAGPGFYGSVLRAAFASDDAATYSVNATAGGIFDGLGTFSFDDGTHGTYDADWPDSFTAQGGAQAALMYNGGLGGTAALQYASGACNRLVYMGFPLETIYPQSTRDAVLSRAMNYLSACVAPTGPDTSIASPADGAAYNALPPFNGTAGGPNGVSAVQVVIISGTQYYNGSMFVSTPTWLTATGTTAWSYPLPGLLDSDYNLKARAIESGAISDTTPAHITFTFDTLPPGVPAPITPTGGITTSSTTPTFMWTGGGNPSGFEFELDGAVEILNTPALSVTRSVAEGAHTWRVRAFDRAGNYSAWSGLATFSAPSGRVYLPLVAKDYTPGSSPTPNCYEAIVNGDFESLDGWTINASGVLAAYVGTPVHGGVRSMRSGIDGQTADRFAYSSFQQTVAIPSEAISATLSFWRYRKSTDTLNDRQMVRAVSSLGDFVDLVNEKVNDPSWNFVQFDLLSLTGYDGPVTLYFNTINNTASGTTAMYIDDVSLQICTP